MNIGRFYFELDSMYANGDQTEKIENFLKGSLSYAQCEGDLASAVSISNEMGGFYRVNGRFSDGERVLKTALGYISDIGMDGTPDHATTLINLATRTRATYARPWRALRQRQISSPRAVRTRAIQPPLSKTTSPPFI